MNLQKDFVGYEYQEITAPAGKVSFIWIVMRTLAGKWTECAGFQRKAPRNAAHEAGQKADS